MNLYRSIVSLVLVTGLAACGHEDQGEETAAPRTVQASVATVEAVSVDAVQALPGTVVAKDRVEVASRMMGFVREMRVQEGQVVDAGEVLFIIDPADAINQADQARLALEQAQAAELDARADYERFAALFKEEAVARQQYDKMRLQHEVAARRVGQAKNQLSIAQNQLRYATVTAPMTAVVTQKLANAGDMAAPGRPLLVLEGIRALQVETRVPAEVLQHIETGMPVEVEIDGVGRREATVAEITPAADPVSHTFTVKLALSAHGPRSGAFARVHFVTGQRQAVLLPATAVVQRAGIEGAFVVDAKGMAQFRMLRLGARQGDKAEVLSGLSAGERVVATVTAALETGDQIVAAGQ